MNNEIQKFDFKGAPLRTLTDKAGEPWFVAKDVCDILELGTEHLRRDLDEDEVTEATNLPNWQVLRKLLQARLEGGSSEYVRIQRRRAGELRTTQRQRRSQS